MLGETVLADNGDSLSSSSSASAFFFSAPASPTHFLLSSSPVHSAHSFIATSHLEQADFEFGLIARSMSTAEELFFNGQIRPGFVSKDQMPLSHPEPVHRRTWSVSVSPTPSPLSRRRDQRLASAASLKTKPQELNPNIASETVSVVSASTSRSSSSNSSSSSSSNANSRRWGFIKDFLSLQRSKSEGGLLGSRPAPQRQRNSNCTNGRMAHSSSFGPGLYKERQRRRGDHKAEMDSNSTVNVKEMHLRRRMTFLPYKQQWFLFGCLGLSSSRLTTNAGIATVYARHS
ncbi:hypothetical protein LUZ63_008763 [Rhynchospora breviuscula]|uniref:Uncharacterized protein n=1 Tax=Rhynchospora breviuscula TaxID=2022672 RepID=A0A9Q0CDW4_9POAL|nr:hypothetical protein LUZ63_008763 [Rhynchospora breviuscula]